MSKLRDKIAGEAARRIMNMIALIPVEETGKRLEKAAEIISSAIDGFDSKLTMAGNGKEDLDVVIERLRKRYAPTEDTKCCVCGGDMRMGMAGQGRIEFYCDSDAASPIGKKGQAGKDATKHYWGSQYIQTHFGNEDVIRILDELDKRRGA